MSIPLVQNNDKDSINTSLNAIKRNLDRINSMLGLVDNTTAGMENEIALLQPVDTVASGNLHSVTSNAVARVLSKSSGTVTYNSNVLQGLINWYRVGNCVYVRFERVVFLEYTGGDRKISVDDQLPRPLYGITAIGNIPPLNANVQSQLITVSPEGALGLGGGYSVANQYFYGGFTYLCAD